MSARLRFGAALAALVTSPALAQLQPTIHLPQRVDVGGGTFASNETSAAASPVNPQHIVAGWNDWRRSPTVSNELINTGFALSLDGGVTWSDFLVRPPAINQSSVEGDPFTAADPRTGALWAGGISFSAFNNSGIYVARKDAGSTTFNDAVMARTTSGTDKPWMVAGPRPGEPDSTRLYIVYNEGVIHSDDLGDTWTTPVTLGFGIGFLPRVGPNGELYVSYWDVDDGMRLARSLDGGQTFTQHLIATRLDVWGVQDGSRFPGTFRVPAMCYIAVNPNDGTLYATYFDTTSVSGGQSNVDIYFTVSTDQGSTWSVPQPINNDNPGDQFFTWIECDEHGRLHLVYCDGRHFFPNPDGAELGRFDAYYAYSVNGGATWTEHRLTLPSWSSAADGLDRPSQFIGDYFGMSLAGNLACPVYPAASATDTDVYINRIELPVPGDVDGDDTVGFSDLLSLLAAWGPCPIAPCAADVDGNGVIDFQDLLALLTYWDA